MGPRPIAWPMIYLPSDPFSETINKVTIIHFSTSTVETDALYMNSDGERLLRDGMDPRPIAWPMIYLPSDLAFSETINKATIICFSALIVEADALCINTDVKPLLRNVMNSC
jgi:hypothetical protein